MSNRPPPKPILDTPLHMFRKVLKKSCTFSDLSMIDSSVVEAQATYDHRRIDLNEAVWFFKLLAEDLIGRTESSVTGGKFGGVNSGGVVARDPSWDLPSRRPEQNNQVEEKEVSKEPEKQSITTSTRAPEISSTREIVSTKPTRDPGRESNGAINQQGGFDGREKRDEV